MLKLGIASTIADSRDSIEQFIVYHKKIGFHVLYLFVDDNDPITIDLASRHQGVTVFKKDEKLYELWRNTPSFKDAEKRGLIDAEVMTRQEFNFHVAHHISKNDGVDWLLHIDIDELYYPNGCDLQTHFKQLQKSDIRSITYLNYEAIPSALDAPSIYLSSTFFKINFFKNKHWFFSERQQAFIRSKPWLNEKYFHYYQNGKSAVSTYGSHLIFHDVHSIFGDGKRKLGDKKDPLILHFPCARLTDFLAKYKRLGNFSDNWRGSRRAGEFIDEIHLQSRDFCTESAYDKDKIRHFYEKKFLLAQQQIDELIQHSLAMQIRFHVQLLSTESHR
jgi:hypothetical protein